MTEEDERRLSYPDPPLTDGVVILRRWVESDLDCVEEASKDPSIPEATTVPASFSAAEGLAWIKRQWRHVEEGEGLSLAIAEADSGEALGAVVLMVRQYDMDTAGLGYWLIGRARGRGLASRAASLAALWGLTVGRFARVEALVEPHNLASQRVLERVGFQREGHLRSVLALETRRADALIYSLLRADLEPIS